MPAAPHRARIESWPEVGKASRSRRRSIWPKPVAHLYDEKRRVVLKHSKQSARRKPSFSPAPEWCGNWVPHRIRATRLFSRKPWRIWMHNYPLSPRSSEATGVSCPSRLRRTGLRHPPGAPATCGAGSSKARVPVRPNRSRLCWLVRVPGNQCLPRKSCPCCQAMSRPRSWDSR